MGQAREVMDRITAAITSGDLEALARCYAPDAVAEGPDIGRLEGRDAVVGYMAGFARAFPDLSWEGRTQLEAGDTAADEGTIRGTNTGPIETPDGQQIPATGRTIAMPEIDIVTVRDGLVASHRFYFDTAAFLRQLGLEGEQEAAVPAPRGAAEQASRDVTTG